MLPAYAPYTLLFAVFLYYAFKIWPPSPPIHLILPPRGSSLLSFYKIFFSFLVWNSGVTGAGGLLSFFFLFPSLLVELFGADKALIFSYRG